MTIFQILGPVQAMLDQRPLGLGGRRQLTLLAFLVLHANRAVSGDTLIDAVWGPARSESDNRLAMAVARLRKALGPLEGPGGPRLQTVSGGYLLSVGPGELDAERFATGVRDGREALEAGDPARAAVLLNEALGLWRGPPLAEVAFEDFAQAEIRRLRELRLTALETRVEADLRLGRDAGLVGELEALLAEQPDRERLAGQLMLALYRQGRQSDALEVYQRTRAHLARELGLEPGPALKALQVQILEQAPSLQAGITEPQRPAGRDGDAGVRSAPRPAARAVPRPPTPTIGREHELEQLARLLCSPESRLVTLTGPGGVGKTRLAIEVVHAIGSSFADGACWVELAGVARSDEVGSAIARALALTPMQGEDPADALRRFLAGKQELLVIDNFEHVLQAAVLVADLQGGCPGLTVLLTSREALNLAAEHRYVVAPLPVPAVPRATVDEIKSTAGSALFLAAVQRRDSRFQVTAESAPAIARICERLDGLPLALELAAARAVALGIERLSAGLQDVGAALGSGPRDAPARQQTLRATIDWSYGLLDEEQAAAFKAFAVFGGGASIEAAEVVTETRADVLEALVLKSLLDHRAQRGGATRLVMLEAVREYALGLLLADPGPDNVRRRHLDY